MDAFTIRPMGMRAAMEKALTGVQAGDGHGPQV
jgi:hypothetical protein